MAPSEPLEFLYLKKWTLFSTSMAICRFVQRGRCMWRNKELTPKSEDTDNMVEAYAQYDRVVFFNIFPRVFG